MTWTPYPKNPNYLVSRAGNIKSVTTGKILKPMRYKNYRLKVHLYSESGRKSEYVHRMVAETYIPNPDNLPEVNHEDGNRYNNRDTNLTWTSEEQNKIHAKKNKLHNNPAGRKAKNCRGMVKAIDKAGKVRYTMYGKRQIESNGFDYNAVLRVISGKQYTHRGLRFIRRNK